MNSKLMTEGALKLWFRSCLKVFVAGNVCLGPHKNRASFDAKPTAPYQG